MSVSAETSSSSNAKHLATLNQIQLLVCLPLFMLSISLPMLGKSLGANAVEIGLLFSVYTLVSVALRPLVGAGLDRFGRRWIFLAGLAASALAMGGYAFSASVSGLVVTRILDGASAAIYGLTISAIVADLADAQSRGSAFGRLSQFAAQGSIVGALLGYVVMTRLGDSGWKPLFLIYAVAGLWAVGAAYRRLPETRSAPLEKEQAYLSDGLRAILHSRPLVILLLVGLVTSAASAMLSPIFLIFLQDKFQADLGTIGWVYLPSGLVWALLTTRLGKLSDRFGRKPLMVLATLIGALDSLLVPQIASMILLAVLWTLEALCFAASGPASQALTTDLIDARLRGRVLGILAFSAGLGAVAGPLVGGWVYDHIGHTTPFLVNAVVLGLSALVLWALLREPARPAQQS